MFPMFSMIPNTKVGHLEGGTKSKVIRVQRWILGPTGERFTFMVNTPVGFQINIGEGVTRFA